ncbi:ERD (early-responsive to dehydration stress) family protein, partial [Trifolium pratense]
SGGAERQRATMRRPAAEQLAIAAAPARIVDFTFLKVYVPKFETGGEFWPTVHTSTIFSLVLMHVIAIGIFGLKKLPLAAGLTLPLPILTLLFNDYCQKRFRSIFKHFPAECLIKKDRADENEHNMSEFYDKMENAYNDPALMPISYSERSDSHRSPLLYSNQV